jgi:uncharacterized membrane protein
MSNRTVEVHPSPLPDQLWALLRQVVPPVATFAIGKGWLANDTAAMLGMVGAAVWAFVAGQLKTRRRAIELAQVAQSPEVPAHVARLRK